MWLNNEDVPAAGGGGSNPLRPSRSAQSCLACTARPSAICGGLDEAALAMLGSLGRHHEFRRGQTIAWEGDDSLFCGNLISGMLKISASTHGGREQIVGLLYPSDFVGRIYAEQVGFTLSALTDATLCLFPRTTFEHFIEDHPAMERLMLRNILSALDDARTRMLMLARKSAEERIAGFLLETMERAAPPMERRSAFDLPLTRGQIADVLGLTIETVSRQLTRLKNAGIIRLKGARTVEILDIGTLALRAGAG